MIFNYLYLFYMEIPQVFSLVKIDDKDDKFISFKNILINELKKKVECENYDEVANFIFQIITTPNLSKEAFEKDFTDVFEDDTNYFQQFIIKHAKEIYGSGEKDLLDEIREEKANKEKDKFQGKGPNYYTKREDYRGRGGKPAEFNLGGKKVVLKGKGNDEENKYNDRSRSRDEEQQQYPSARNTGFHVPRGMIRGNFVRYPKTFGRGGMPGRPIREYNPLE